MKHMTTVSKVSISLPPELAADIKSAAKQQGVSTSAWVADAVAHQLRLRAAEEFVAEWEAEHGPLTQADRDQARARLGLPAHEVATPQNQTPQDQEIRAA